LRVVRAEFLVVVNEISVRLRSNEDAGHEIKAQRSTDVHKHMVVAHKIAAGEGAATCKRLIEADALAANAGQKFRLSYFAPPWSIEQIKVVQDWPVRLKSLIEVLACAPGNFALESHVVLEDEIATEAEECASSKRLGGVLA
jgi:hypothetical protein